MYALDFEYDGQYLSDYGFIICDFNSNSGANIVSAGSKITFNTVSRNRGKKYGLIGTQYDECIQATFSICKNPDIFDDLCITDDEYRDLMRWLNRNEFIRFQILYDNENRDSCYYDASFNINKVTIREILYGLELTMETNRPFGYGQEYVISINANDVEKTYTFYDPSDEIGYIYPSLTILCNDDGDLTIHNDYEDCTMLIKNCKAGEVININGNALIISSSYESHNICNDFNYEFFKIGNTANNRINRISVSIPCLLEIKYCPVIKGSL